MAFEAGNNEERAHICATKSYDNDEDNEDALTIARSDGSGNSRPCKIVTRPTIFLACIFWSMFVWTSSQRQMVTTRSFVDDPAKSWFTPQEENQTESFHANEENGSSEFLNASKEAHDKEAGVVTTAPFAEGATKSSLTPQQEQQTTTVHADEQKGSVDVNEDNHDKQAMLDKGKKRDADEDFKLVNPSPMCKPFMQSPTTIWAEHVDRIHAASQLPGDSDFFNHDLHAVLLQLISPRLPSSVRMVEKDTAKIEVILTKAYKRYQYLTQQRHGHDVEPPPVVILVMGGSVTRGRRCIVEGHKTEFREEWCSWPARLEKLINALAGGELVVVHNMARGATETRIGVVMLEAKLLPSSAQQPDIVISAYSTNDQNQKYTPQTLHDFFFAQEKFIRMVLQWRPCKESKYQPIMMYFDEFQGGQPDETIVNILSTIATQNYNILASYYGASYASYAQAVRDIVFGDAKEYLLSPREWFQKEGEFHKQVHPGQGMHLATSWIISYNLLNMVTTYCSFESWKVAEGEKTMLYNHTKVPGLPTLRSSHGEPKGKARPSPETILPSLSSDLSLATITDEWRSIQEDGVASQERCHSDVFNATNQSSTPSQSSTTTTFDGGITSCPFKWWWADYTGARPPMEKLVIATKDVFKPIVEKYSGWSVTPEYNKMGWVPPSNNPIGKKFTVRFPRYKETVRTVTYLYMKSYGQGWDGSIVDIQLSTKIDDDANAGSGRSKGKQKHHPNNNNNIWSELTSTQLYGSHDSNTSEIYAERIELPIAIQPGTQLRTSITLVAGEKFKLMGLLVCS